MSNSHIEKFNNCLTLLSIYYIETVLNAVDEEYIKEFNKKFKSWQKEVENEAGLSIYLIKEITFYLKMKKDYSLMKLLDILMT